MGLAAFDRLARNISDGLAPGRAGAAAQPDEFFIGLPNEKQRAWGPDDIVLDAEGNVVPESLRNVFIARQTLKPRLKQLNAFAAAVDQYHDLCEIDRYEAATHVEALRDIFESRTAYALCPECNLHGGYVLGTCICEGRGWVSAKVYHRWKGNHLGVVSED